MGGRDLPPVDLVHAQGLPRPWGSRSRTSVTSTRAASRCSAAAATAAMSGSVAAKPRVTDHATVGGRAAVQPNHRGVLEGVIGVASQRPPMFSPARSRAGSSPVMASAEDAAPGGGDAHRSAPSLPVANSTSPAATAAAEPAEDPLGGH
jgi:hypothetical protein